LLEVALTRIFSTLMFYHFAFLTIAVALLGLGTSGVWVYVSKRFPAHTVRADMASASLRFAATTILALVYVLGNPITTQVAIGAGPQFTSTTLFQLALLCAVTMLPFFYAGLVVTLAITHFPSCVDRIYVWDLCGAGLAAVVVGLAISALGAPALVVLIALLGCCAAVLLVPVRRHSLTALGLALLLLAALTTRLFSIPSTKSVRQERVVFDRWNTFSHVTVETIGSEKYDIRIDSAARTPIAHVRDASSNQWMTDISALGYTVHPGGAKSALVIGPGGGIDVARALASGVRHVSAVDVNALIASDIMRGEFEAASGGLYKDPRVSVVVSEGRSFIRRSDQRFQIIQLSMVDTWAATASGAFALTENALYTLEAFQDYRAHLTDDGILAVTRWWNFLSGPESRRMTVLAAGALEAEGIEPSQTRRHLYLAAHDAFATLLVKKTPFGRAELARLDEWCERLGHKIIFSPTVDNDPELVKMIEAGAWSAQVAAAADDLRPPTDDRSFFFYFVKPGHLLQSALANPYVTNPAAWLIGALSAVLVVMASVLVVLPLTTRRLRKLNVANVERHSMRRAMGLGYFATIGMAFMVIEIALMQRLSLLLGHPAYALVVVLFAILIGTAGGARLSALFTARPERGTAAGAALVAGLAVLAGVLLADVVRSLVGLSLPVRAAVSVVIVSVFGLGMGLMMPLGMRLLTRQDPDMIPWAWGINGGMSVIGTVGATILAINCGFGITFYVGALLYIMAALLGLTLARGDDEQPAVG
jgi:spermidine synthase